MCLSSTTCFDYMKQYCESPGQSQHCIRQLCVHSVKDNENREFFSIHSPITFLSNYSYSMKILDKLICKYILILLAPTGAFYTALTSGFSEEVKVSVSHYSWTLIKQDFKSFFKTWEYRRFEEGCGFREFTQTFNSKVLGQHRNWERGEGELVEQQKVWRKWYRPESSHGLRRQKEHPMDKVPHEYKQGDGEQEQASAWLAGKPQGLWHMHTTLALGNKRTVSSRSAQQDLKQTKHSKEYTRWKIRWLQNFYWGLKSLTVRNWLFSG